MGPTTFISSTNLQCDAPQYSEPQFPFLKTRNEADVGCPACHYSKDRRVKMEGLENGLSALPLVCIPRTADCTQLTVNTLHVLWILGQGRTQP